MVQMIVKNQGQKEIRQEDQHAEQGTGGGLPEATAANFLAAVHAIRPGFG